MLTIFRPLSRAKLAPTEKKKRLMPKTLHTRFNEMIINVVRKEIIISADGGYRILVPRLLRFREFNLHA